MRSAVSSVSQSTVSFVMKLVRTFPDLQGALDEHLVDFDDMLPHLFMSDVARWAESRWQANTPELKKFAALISSAYRYGHSDVQNLLYVSFFEDLTPGSPIFRAVEKAFR